MIEYTDCPACGDVFVRRASDDEQIIPTHTWADLPGPGCWANGWTVAAVLDMIDMRDADGGRLLRAAHP